MLLAMVANTLLPEAFGVEDWNGLVVVGEPSYLDRTERDLGWDDVCDLVRRRSRAGKPTGEPKLKPPNTSWNISVRSL